ncbi:hypothetical protein [Haloglomus litoreum]|uniref:hypothetical protein n=1 Tax=Haloglomus litoreum TaxID=3034026 RepID=UPI0023E83AD2|nr:hypothetical protein [Haloglomus sp. DT116]
MATTRRRTTDRKQFRRDLVCVLLDRYGSGQTIFTLEELAAALDTDTHDIETAMGRLEQYGPLSVLRLSHGPADELRWRVRP